MTQPNHRNITIWLPTAVISDIDARVARISRTPGCRTSRNAWMVDALMAALADPVLMAHRGRLADAEAPPLAEVGP